MSSARRSHLKDLIPYRTDLESLADNFLTMRTSIHATLVALALAQQALAQLVVPACFQACGDTAAQQLGCNDRSNYACYCGNQVSIHR